MQLGFMVKEALRALARNLTTTIAMIITTAISLLMFGYGLVLADMADRTKDQWVDRTEISVFLNQGASTADPACAQPGCQALRDDLSATPGVQGVTFVDQQASKELLAKRDPNFEDVDAEALPASFRVKLDGVTSSTDAVAETVAKHPDVVDQQAIDDQRPIVDSLYNFLDALRNSVFGLAIVQAIGAILLIANMVQVAAYNRRDTTTIMRLVGASRFTTGAPFTIEVVLASLIGSLVAIGSMFAVHRWLLSDLLANMENSRVLAPITATDILAVSPWLMLAAVSISAVTSIVTLPMYVRR